MFIVMAVLWLITPSHVQELGQYPNINACLSARQIIAAQKPAAAGIGSFICVPVPIYVEPEEKEFF